MITAAMNYRQAERNTPLDLSTNPPTLLNSVYCQKAPKNVQLNDLVQAQDPANDPNSFFDPSTGAIVARGSQPNTSPFGANSIDAVDYVSGLAVDLAKVIVLGDQNRLVARHKKNGTSDHDGSNKHGDKKGGGNKDGDKKDGNKKDGDKKDGNKKDGGKDGNKKDGGKKDGNKKDGNKNDGNKNDGNKNDGGKKDGGKKDGNEKDGGSKDGKDNGCHKHHGDHKHGGKNHGDKKGGNQNGGNTHNGNKTHSQDIEEDDSENTDSCSSQTPLDGNGSGNKSHHGGNKTADALKNNNGTNGTLLVSGNIGNFGSCSVPEIKFAAGFDGRRETSFEPVDKGNISPFPPTIRNVRLTSIAVSYNHGSAQNIDIITQFMCDQLVNTCKADATAQSTCARAKSAADGAPPKTGKQADAFNAVFGKMTHFANVTALDNQGKPIAARSLRRRTLGTMRGVASCPECV